MKNLKLSLGGNVDFADFWKLYPRKVAKKDAEKAWNKLTAAQKQKALDTVPMHVVCWCSECRETHKIPHAATWLNGERFDDEITVSRPKSLADLGRSRGIEARPGESTEQYERRILQTRH